MIKLLHIWLPLMFRLVRSHRRKSLATALFIAVGTAVLVFMHAMTVGISDTMVLNTTALHTGHAFTEFRLMRLNPEAVADTVMKNPAVLVALPRYRFSGFIRHGEDTAPAQVFGVRADAEQKTTAIAGRIVEGVYPSAEKHEALIGKGLADDMDLKAGDTMNIWQTGGNGLGTFTVKGIFETDIERFDKGVVYIPIETFNYPARKQSVSEVSVFLRNPAEVDKSVKSLNAAIPPRLKIEFRPWLDLMPDLVQLIRLNSVSTTILMALVFALVGFGISNIFVLTIVERFRELAILKSMGTTPGEIMFLVFLESFMVCTAATLVGLIAGWVCSSVAASMGIDLSALTSHNRYFVVSGVVHPRATFTGLIWPFIISFTVSLVASWLPARVVGRKLTAEALRSL